MAGGVAVGAGLGIGTAINSSKGILIGKTQKPQKGRIEIGYGASEKKNGGTIINYNNSNGSSRFRVDIDHDHLLHVHYGHSGKLRDQHRNEPVKLFLGIMSGVAAFLK
ncbi:MAG: hypothetical protein IKQ96_06115 [Lachnospiraceae bacterium]|nr:hypothetical protein [Lachnospiraceae bacterium]